MPELPEVEVLMRHLAPALKNKTIRRVVVCRAKVITPASTRQLARVLTGAKFTGISRRGKYLVFTLRPPGQREPITLVGHLGMTGRIFLQPKDELLPKHTAVCLYLGRQKFVYEDQRYFGRLTLDTSSLTRLGPEPLEPGFTAKYLGTALSRSTQAIKVKLLDQTLVAGVGNIYASEALFLAGISPCLPARKLDVRQITALRRTIRTVLREAIRCGSTIPLNFNDASKSDGLFYFGRAADVPDYYAERLRVYDRIGQPCLRCQTRIQRIVQAGRSTFYCPKCQTK